MPIGPASFSVDRYRPLAEQDATRAAAAAPNPAAAYGAATRERVVGPVSYAMEGAINAGAPIRNAVSDFTKGLLGTTSTTAGDGSMPGVRPVMPNAVRPSFTPPVAGPVATAQPAARAIEGEVLPPETPATRGVSPPPAFTGNTQVPWIGNNRGQAMGPVAGLITSNLALRQAGAIQGNAQRSFTNTLKARKENVTSRGLELDLADREGIEALRRLAVGGDEKALAKYRNVQAAKLGKSPEEGMNEKLLEAYIKSTAEYNKDPSNMGKAAPSFTDFLGQLPPAMFPNAAKSGTPLPTGMKRQVGTSNGVPVYEDGSGKRFTAQ